jgi:hypothetical protein
MVGGDEIANQCQSARHVLRFDREKNQRCGVQELGGAGHGLSAGRRREALRRLRGDVVTDDSLGADDA